MFQNGMQSVSDKLNRLIQCLSEYFNILSNWPMYIKRLIYMCGGVSLCYIDQMIGSATGYIQYGYKNYTGIIIGIFILSSYSLKDFVKLPYFIWIITFFLLREMAADFFKGFLDNDLNIQTNLWGIGLYGIIFIRMFYLYVVERKCPKINWFFLSSGIFMMLGMTIIRMDYEWPKCLLGAFVCFFLTEFKEKDLNNLFSGMLSGIILGFILIQGQAWMYRPFDFFRYLGMYSHANTNALMYLFAYCAVLAKWYLMKLKRNCVFLRVPYILLAGLIISTMLYTGSRSGFIAAAVLTLVFLIFQLLSRKYFGIIDFVLDAALLGISITICVLPAFWLIRYVPMRVNEPIYFESDNESEKVQKNEAHDSEKYIEFDEASAVMFDRYLWFLKEEDQVNVEQWIRNIPERMREKLQLILRVDAAEFSNMPGDSAENPLQWREEREEYYDVRLEIYDYFLKKLKWIAEEDTVQGVWLTKWNFASHCHNVFLQIAYDFGLIIGFWFIGIVMLMYICFFIGLIRRRSGPWYFRLYVATSYTTLFVVFGMFECVWIYGQLPFTLFFMMQYIVYHQDIFYRGKPKKAKRVKAKPVREVPEEQVDMPELEIVDLD